MTMFVYKPEFDLFDYIGIKCIPMEVKETKACFTTGGRRFKKENVGIVYDGEVVFTERNDEAAQKVWADHFAAMRDDYIKKAARMEQAVAAMYNPIIF